MPQTDKPKFSIVIPCFNEGDTLTEVIIGMREVFDREGFSGQYELILVDDGSHDHSALEIEALAKANDHFVPVICSENGGMWRAIHAGFQVVCGEFVTYLPSDGEIGAAEAVKLMRLAGDHDLVISDRQAADAATQRAVRPWYREVLSFGHRALIRLMLGCDVSGAEGIFLFRWTAFGHYARAPRNDNVLFLEILARGLRGNYRVGKTVMVYERRRAGRSKTAHLGYVLGTLRDIVLLRFRILRSSL